MKLKIYALPFGNCSLIVDFLVIFCGNHTLSIKWLISLLHILCLFLMRSRQTTLVQASLQQCRVSLRLTTCFNHGRDSLLQIYRWLIFHIILISRYLNYIEMIEISKGFIWNERDEWIWNTNDYHVVKCNLIKKA